MIPSQPWIIRPIVKKLRQVALKSTRYDQVDCLATYLNYYGCGPNLWFLIKAKIFSQKGTTKELWQIMRFTKKIAYSQLSKEDTENENQAKTSSTKRLKPYIKGFQIPFCPCDF